MTLRTRLARLASTLADRLPASSSAARSRIGRSVTIFLLVLVVGPSLMAGTAAADDGGLELCHKAYEGTDNYNIMPEESAYDNSNTEYKDFVSVLRNFVGALMVMGPVCGIVMFLFATVARSAQFSNDGDGKYMKMRRDALVYGFSVPIAAYGLEVLAHAILGMEISCIVP